MKPVVLLSASEQKFSFSVPVSEDEYAATTTINVRVYGPNLSDYWAAPNPYIMLSDEERAFAENLAKLETARIIQSRQASAKP